VSAWIEVSGHRIGSGHPCFVIAEIGVNHNGDGALAHRLIEAAVAAGADAVKFQAFNPDLVASSRAPQAAYQVERAAAASQRDMLSRLALDAATFAALRSHTDDQRIVFMASPFDEPAVEMLAELRVPAIKIASGEVTNPGLLADVAATGLPILMSTGMCTLDEVDVAVASLERASDRLALLHCVSSYPAVPDDCNLLAMDVMRERFHVPVGWSDHTDGIAVALGAVALGANIVEKHLTLDRSDEGPDHAASIEPDAFRAMVDGIRTVEAARGVAQKTPSRSELEIAAVARRSLHWRRGLGPDEIVGPDDIVALRPGTGLPPSELGELVGRRTRVATLEGTLVTRAQLEGSGVNAHG
jgi:N-acetylneuraminate synthase/N,N'-diacetyllegionaminate synthase